MWGVLCCFGFQQRPEILHLCQSFAEGDLEEEGTKHGTVSEGDMGEMWDVLGSGSQ